MSVLINTSIGDIVIDLFIKECPLTWDPTGTGKGGNSIYGIMYGEQAKTFEDEIHLNTLKHTKKGLVSMANAGIPHSNTSQFFITCRNDDLEFLDGKHTIFGEIAEGMDIVDKLNSIYVDDNGRPYQDIRILHTYILEDPFEDPPILKDLLPKYNMSPIEDKPKEEIAEQRIGINEKLDDNEGKTLEEIENHLKAKVAKSRAVVLEMIGDIPDADIKPPEEVIFVCKLNPVTTADDLEIIFSRFGPCKCDIIRDYKTGDSLCYGFVEFQEKKYCEQAFVRMNNVLIDDRRIKVDFSQSVSKLWNKFARRPWEKHSKDDQDPYNIVNKNNKDKHINKQQETYNDKYKDKDKHQDTFKDKYKHKDKDKYEDKYNDKYKNKQPDRYKDKFKDKDKNKDKEKKNVYSSLRNQSDHKHKREPRKRSLSMDLVKSKNQEDYNSRNRSREKVYHHSSYNNKRSRHDKDRSNNRY